MESVLIHPYKAKPDEGGTDTDDLAKFFKDTGYSKVPKIQDGEGQLAVSPG